MYCACCLFLQCDDGYKNLLNLAFSPCFKECMLPVKRSRDDDDFVRTLPSHNTKALQRNNNLNQTKSSNNQEEIHPTKEMKPQQTTQHSGNEHKTPKTHQQQGTKNWYQGLEHHQQGQKGQKPQQGTEMQGQNEQN
ncbi:hypothetical protein LXL04_002562 [Taraxacum kok-saghyz]